MKEWLLGCAALVVANLGWELILVYTGPPEAGFVGLFVRTLWMVFTFGLWTIARRKYL